MKTTTTVSDFDVTKNQILGRLSQSTDADQLVHQMKEEIRGLGTTMRAHTILESEKAALIGIDISQGITAANKAIEGDPEPLDTL